MTDEHELGAVGDGVGGGRLFGPDLAGVVAAEPFGIGAVHHREVQRRVEPARPVGDELRVDREARRQDMPLATRSPRGARPRRATDVPG